MPIIRDMLQSDLETLFEYEQDAGANYMAAFTSENPSNKEAFLAFWKRILENPQLIKQAIEVDGKVVGSIVCYEMFEQTSVGYRIGREFWGKGYASQALAELVAKISERPLYGRCVSDNIGSRRVLEKCGFKLFDQERSYANARGEEVDELIFKLD